MSNNSLDIFSTTAEGNTIVDYVAVVAAFIQQLLQHI